MYEVLKAIPYCRLCRVQPPGATPEASWSRSSIFAKIPAPFRPSKASAFRAA